jgi:hypothetical protein
MRMARLQRLLHRDQDTLIRSKAYAMPFQLQASVVDADSLRFSLKIPISDS